MTEFRGEVERIMKFANFPIKYLYNIYESLEDSNNGTGKGHQNSNSKQFLHKHISEADTTYKYKFAS
jgi:hypothetical protein